MSNSRTRSEPHDGGAREEYNLYKAECKNICYDEVRSFYGLGSSNAKITTTDNFVTADRLLEKYPSTALSIINMVSHPVYFIFSRTYLISKLILYAIQAY